MNEHAQQVRVPKKITVEITHRTIIFTVVFLLILYFLFYIRDILLQIFIAFLIAAILNPLVSRLANYKIPRSLSILVVYILCIGFVSMSIVEIAPPLIDESTRFLENAPSYVDTFGSGNLFARQLINEIVGFVGSIPSQVARASISLLSNVVDVFTVLILAFYLLLARNRIAEQTGVLLKEFDSEEIHKVYSDIEKKLGGWALGQLSLMFLVGLVTYIGLLLLQIPYALPLGILAGLLEVVPYVGPLVASVPAILIGFSISPIMGMATAALTFLVQQIENYLLVPKVMERTAGVSPLITLVALSVGFKIAGVLGVFISVPTVIIIQIIAREYLNNR